MRTLFATRATLQGLCLEGMPWLQAALLPGTNEAGRTQRLDDSYRCALGDPLSHLYIASSPKLFAHQLPEALQ